MLRKVRLNTPASYHQQPKAHLPTKEHNRHWRNTNSDFLFRRQARWQRVSG